MTALPLSEENCVQKVHAEHNEWPMMEGYLGVRLFHS
jgi:hypothetical protein